VNASSPRFSGLRESHAHLPMHGRALSLLKLGGVGSVHECLEAVAHAASIPCEPRSWVLAVQLRIEGWTDPRWPTMQELDEVCPDRPCCLMSFDHHSVVVNTHALRAAGFTHSSPDPDAGVLVRDREGQPTGVLLESAAMKAWHSAPEPTPNERKDHVRAAITDLACHGFVEVHDLLSPDWLGPTLAELDGEEPLPLRVGLFAPLDRVRYQHEASASWSRADRIRLLGGKIFADGTLNSRTAWMLHPYREPLDGHPLGKPLVTRDSVLAAMRACAALNVQLAVHAIGDAAVRCVLDAAEQQAGRQPNQRPLRIEHAELVDSADVGRFAPLGVVASVQPCHLLTDVEILRRELPHRLDRVFPLREFIDTGCTPGDLLVFGSDTPIVRPHPEDSIRAAVYRRRPDQPAEAAIGLEHALSELECRAAFAAPPPPG